MGKNVKYDVYSMECTDSIGVVIDAPVRIWLSNCIDPDLPRQYPVVSDIDLTQWIQDAPMSAIATEAYWESWMRGYPGTKVTFTNVASRWLLVERGELK